LGRDHFRNRGTERFAAMLARDEIRKPFAALRLANRDELHLGRDDAFTRVMHLRHVPAGFRAPGLAMQVEAQRREFRVREPLAAVSRSRAFELLGIAAL